MHQSIWARINQSIKNESDILIELNQYGKTQVPWEGELFWETNWEAEWVLLTVNVTTCLLSKSKYNFFI